MLQPILIHSNLKGVNKLTKKKKVQREKKGAHLATPPLNITGRKVETGRLK